MNLAVFLPNWIGDVVMATPAIRALRERYPSAHLIAVSRPYVVGVLEGSPWINEVVPFDSKGRWANRWPAVAYALRKKKIDLAVLFPNSFRSAWTAWWAGCRRRIGYDRYNRGILLTDRLSPKKSPEGTYTPTPILDDYNKLAMAAGCTWPGHRMEIFTTPADEERAEAVLARWKGTPSRDFICFNPGAAFGAAKHWHVESFARLAQELVDTRDANVLVLCGPSEREMARQIAKLSARPQVSSLADEPLSLGLTKALIRRCSLLVTTDSGPRHFAAALDRPVVSLFGPTHIAWTETYFAKAIHLQKKVACGPCQRRVCPTDHACMTTLTPADVLAAARQLLDRDLAPSSARKAS